MVQDQCSADRKAPLVDQVEVQIAIVAHTSYLDLHLEDMEAQQIVAAFAGQERRAVLVLVAAVLRRWAEALLPSHQLAIAHMMGVQKCPVVVQ